MKKTAFSLHAGVAAQAWERLKLERLCRYITRPVVSENRLSVTLAKRGKGRRHPEGEEKTLKHHHQAMNWAQRLKRVFNIPQGTLSRCSASNHLVDVSICLKCGGEAKVIASIEDQVVIDKILQHLQAKGALPQASDLLAATRASPTITTHHGN
jgi:hypothetical protein